VAAATVYAIPAVTFPPSYERYLKKVTKEEKFTDYCSFSYDIVVLFNNQGKNHNLD
jgi:hypothetical protein